MKQIINYTYLSIVFIGWLAFATLMCIGFAESMETHAHAECSTLLSALAIFAFNMGLVFLKK